MREIALARVTSAGGRLKVLFRVWSASSIRLASSSGSAAVFLGGPASDRVVGFGDASSAAVGEVIRVAGVLEVFLAGQVYEGLECPLAPHRAHFRVGGLPCFIFSMHTWLQ